MTPSLSAPLDVEIAISAKCQLRCGYCSAMPFDGGVAHFGRTSELIAELGEMRVFSLLLSGGEPSLHPRFFDLVRVASTCIPILSINSNGLKFASYSFAATFHDLAPHALVSISLDSVDPLLNNQSRGAGSAKAMAAIENCVKLGQPTCISAVLTPTNISSAALLVKAYAPNVRKFKFFPWVPRNEQDLAILGASYERSLAEFYGSANKLRDRNPGVEIITPISAGSTQTIDERNIQCTCGSTKIFIDTKLNVYPCYYTSSKANLLGSAVDLSIREIWNSDGAQAIRDRAFTNRLCGVKLGQRAIPTKYISGADN